MGEELISVIIPNFNNAEFIEACLESVRRQTHRSLEIIVVDDCSTDGSPQIIRSFAERDRRIKPVFNERNLGVSRNRHKGILLASGTYISTLDGDDLYASPGKLAAELEVLTEKRREGCDNVIAFSGVVLVDRRGNEIGKPRGEVVEGDILNRLLGRSCIIPRDFLFTREQYLAAGGFDANIPIYEDWDLKIRLASENRFFYSGCKGIGYRRHGRGLSATSPLRHSWWLVKIFIKNFHLLRCERSRTVGKFILFLAGMYVNYARKKVSSMRPSR